MSPVRPSPLSKIFQNKAKLPVKTVIATGGTVGLADGIIDDTCFVYNHIHFAKADNQ